MVPTHLTTRLALIGLLSSSRLVAQDTAAFPPIVTKQAEVSVGGQTLRYTVRAGHLPIRVNTTGETHGMMFFTSYTLAPPAGAPPRPITFAWNGGPGSPAGSVHMAFGPKNYPGGVLRDNPDTWLPFTDLVFIDPIGTGWSRPTKAEYGSEFYQTRGDAESVAEFIRAYRVHYDATRSPLFLMGESYGVERAGLVAEVLQRRNIRTNGMILLSGSSPFASAATRGSRGLELLPALTAGAYANKKLPPDLQNGTLEHAVKAAEAYVEGPYAAALAKLPSLTDAERDAV